MINYTYTYPTDFRILHLMLFFSVIFDPMCDFYLFLCVLFDFGKSSWSVNRIE